MPRDSELYLNDIQAAISNIERFTAGMKEAEFLPEDIRVHGTLYNLMIIGEAVKNLPAETQAAFPSVAWRDIERFRDKLVHHYFGIRTNLVWQIIQEDLPQLKEAVSQLLLIKKDTDG